MIATNTMEKKQVKIVHLGSVDSLHGKINKSNKTRKSIECLAQRQFQCIEPRCIVIDRRIPEDLPSGCEYINSDFLEGLKYLQNNEIYIISSEMSLGYYGAEGTERYRFSYDGRNKEIDEYTIEVMQQVHSKLRRGGRLNIVAAEEFEALSCILNSIQKTPMKIVTNRMLYEHEKGRTDYIRTHSEMGFMLHQVIAIKQ